MYKTLFEILMNSQGLLHCLYRSEGAPVLLLHGPSGHELIIIHGSDKVRDYERALITWWPC